MPLEGSLGTLWGLLGELLGPLEAHLGLLGASWELSWGLLGASLGFLGAPLLGDMNWVDFGTLFGSQKGSQKAPKIEPKSHTILDIEKVALQTVLGASWVDLGAFLAPCEGAKTLKNH